MKKFLIAISFFPALAFAGQSKSFAQKQAEQLNEQRELIIEQVEQGEFAGRQKVCLHHVRILSMIKSNAIQTAQSLGESTSVLEAVATLDESICQ